MFQNTCSDFLKTVMPIVIAWRTGRGKIEYGIGAGLIVNDSGHFITAGHILNQIRDLDKAVNSSKKPSRQSNRVSHYTAIFGTTEAVLAEGKMNNEIDLGIGKLEGYNSPPNHKYPILRSSDVQQGEFLCRAGYPFVEDLKPRWVNGKFDFQNLFPLPLFVNEALISRFVELRTGTWLETSTPGLQGQSGGPLADTEGLICGIQVNTAHYSLGFRGKNQVLNVGRAVHVKSVRQFLDENGVDYLSEGDS